MQHFAGFSPEQGRILAIAFITFFIFVVIIFIGILILLVNTVIVAVKTPKNDRDLKRKKDVKDMWIVFGIVVLLIVIQGLYNILTT